MLWELISYFLINFSIFFIFYLATLALRISLPLLRKCQEEATSTGCTPATARWVSAALSSTCRQFVLINQQREVPRSHLLGSEPVCGKVGSWLALFLRNTSGRAKAIEIGLTFFFSFLPRMSAHFSAGRPPDLHLDRKREAASNRKWLKAWNKSPATTAAAAQWRNDKFSGVGHKG